MKTGEWQRARGRRAPWTHLLLGGGVTLASRRPERERPALAEPPEASSLGQGQALPWTLEPQGQGRRVWGPPPQPLSLCPHPHRQVRCF